MATTKPPHNGAQATEDLLEVEVFKGNPNTLIVKDESLRYRFIQLPRQHLNQILLMFFFAVFVFLLFSLLRSAYQTGALPNSYEPLGRELVRGFHRIRSVAEGIGPVRNV